MNKLAIIILTLFVMGCSENKNDLKNQNLNGEVKYVTQNTYYAIEKFGEITKGGEIDDMEDISDRYMLFNSSGYLIEKKNVYQGKIKYIYDNNNNLIKKQSFNDENLFWVEKLKYDKKNNLIEINKFNIVEGKTKFASRMKYIYDKSGNPTILNEYNSDGQLIMRFISDYMDGKKTIQNIYDNDGKLFSQTGYIYDENENIIKEIESHIYNSILMIYRSTIKKYNDKNDVVVEEWSSHDNLYEKNSNLDKNYNYEYIYDKNNNFIKQIIFKNGKPEKILEREIEYY